MKKLLLLSLLLNTLPTSLYGNIDSSFYYVSPTKAELKVLGNIIENITKETENGVTDSTKKLKLLIDLFEYLETYVINRFHSGDRKLGIIELWTEINHLRPKRRPLWYSVVDEVANNFNDKENLNNKYPHPQVLGNYIKYMCTHGHNAFNHRYEHPKRCDECPDKKIIDAIHAKKNEMDKFYNALKEFWRRLIVHFPNIAKNLPTLI